MSMVPHRRHRETGSSLVETALVLALLLAIILAIFDFAVAVFVQTTLQHATREGVRYAVTYQTLPGMGHDASIKSVVQAAAGGFLRGPQGEEKIRIRYYDPLTFQEVPGNSPGNVIEVSVEDFTWGWLVPFLRSAAPVTLTARAADRMEALPGGVNPPQR